MRDSLRRTHALIIAAIVAATVNSPTAASALDDLCDRRELARPDAAPGSLRSKASRFAPRLVVRFWFRPGADTRQRESAQSSALAEAPAPPRRPTRLDADVEEPFGWQVSLRWDLAEMAEAVAPQRFAEPARPLPSECLMRDAAAERFFDEYEGELQ